MRFIHSFLREAAFMRLNRSIIVALLLVFSLSSLTVIGGLFEVERQHNTIEQLLSTDAEDRLSAISGQETWGGAAYYSFHLTYDPPSEFAFAAMGQRDSRPWKHRIRMLALEGQIYERDVNNPVVALIGRFDFSFFVAFVLPFIIIILLHDLRSGERREGRLHLLVATSTQSNIWLVRTAVLSVSIYMAAMLPLVIASIINNVSLLTISKVSLFLCVYVIFWAAISFWFASWKKSSSVILASLIGFWALVSIIIPTGGRIAIDNYATVPSGSDILMMQRESVNNAWDIPKEDTMQAFLEYHPEWSEYSKIERPFEWKWYFAFQQVGDQKTEKLSNAYREGRLIRDNIASYLSFLAPPVLMERSLQDLAKTDTKSNLKYELNIREFHKKLRDFYYPKLFKKQLFEAEILTKLPQFQPNDIE